MHPITSSFPLFYLLVVWVIDSGSGSPFSSLSSSPLDPSQDVYLRSRDSQQSSPILSSISRSEEEAEQQSVKPSSLSPSLQEKRRFPLKRSSSQQESRSTYPLLVDHQFFDQIPSLAVFPLMSPSSSAAEHESPEVGVKRGMRVSRRLTPIVLPQIVRKRQTTRVTGEKVTKRVNNRQESVIDPNYYYFYYDSRTDPGNSTTTTTATPLIDRQDEDNMINSRHGEQETGQQQAEQRYKKAALFVSPLDRKSGNSHAVDSRRKNMEMRRTRDTRDHPSSSVVASRGSTATGVQSPTLASGQESQRMDGPATRDGDHSSSSPSTSSSASSSSSRSSSLLRSPLRSSSASQFMDLIPARRTRESHYYDVPQVECPPSDDDMDSFACPSPDSLGRFRCIGSHALCDGFHDCPKGEDEDRKSCLFYKSVSSSDREGYTCSARDRKRTGGKEGEDLLGKQMESSGRDSRTDLSLTISESHVSSASILLLSFG